MCGSPTHCPRPSTGEASQIRNICQHPGPPPRTPLTSGQRQCRGAFRRPGFLRPPGMCTGVLEALALEGKRGGGAEGRENNKPLSWCYQKSPRNLALEEETALLTSRPLASVLATPRWKNHSQQSLTNPGILPLGKRYTSNSELLSSRGQPQAPTPLQSGFSRGDQPAPIRHRWGQAESFGDLIDDSSTEDDAREAQVL